MNIKKIISLLLTIVMCAGIMTMPVVADEALVDEILVAEENVADSGAIDAANPIVDIESDAALEQNVASETEIETIEIELPEPETVTDISVADLAAQSEHIGNKADIEGAKVLSRNQSQARSAEDFYDTYEGFIPDPTQWDVNACYVGANQYIQVQMDLPNSAALDYDLMLIIEIAGELYLLDSSSNRTYINGTNGTLPEIAGWKNTTGATQLVYIIAESYSGSSSSLPFKCHVAVTDKFDAYEPDSIHYSIGFTIPSYASSSSIGIRSLLTKADNDWYRFTVPAGSTINEAYVSLDSTSESLGHRAELYTLQNGKAIRVIGSSVSAGTTYYIRVHSFQKQLKGSNYTLYINTYAPPPVLGRITIPRTTIRDYGDVGIVYLGTVRWEMYGTLEYDFGYTTPDRTVLVLEFPAEQPNHLSGTEEFIISNRSRGSISLPYLYLSKNVKVYIANDSMGGELVVQGSITSYGRS